MFYHFIAIASSYFEGRRVGYHHVSKDKIDEKIINYFLEKTQVELERADFGLHILTTEDITWKSVIETDSFFKDILVCDDSEEFINFLAKDKELTAVDIAKFFLSLMPMSQLKLQKMIYLAYATHLEITGQQLFKDKIVAYKYGPVVEDVYQEYKQYGREKIDENQQVKFTLEDVRFPQSVARVSISKNGAKILQSLLITFRLYSTKTPGELVDITHSEGSPWSIVFEPNANKQIEDSLILSNHIYEKSA